MSQRGSIMAEFMDKVKSMSTDGIIAILDGDGELYADEYYFAMDTLERRAHSGDADARKYLMG